MSGFGTILNSVSKSSNVLDFNGNHYSENQFDGNVWISRDNGVTKIYPVSYTSWEYTKIVAEFNAVDLIPGTYCAGVVSGSDEESNKLDDVFVLYQPNITSISPDPVDEAGGEIVTIIGTGFTAAGTLTLDGAPITPISWSTDEIIFLSVPHSVGIVSVEVTNGDGFSDSVNLEYVASATDVNPRQGLIPELGEEYLVGTTTNFFNSEEDRYI